MSVCQTAIRRRRMWRIKFRHVAKRGRPIYPRPVAKEIASERVRRAIAAEQERKMRKARNASSSS